MNKEEEVISDKPDNKQETLDLNKANIWGDFFTKTLSSIISGVVIAVVGLYIWHKQNMTTQQQKLYDNKIETFNKMASDGGKMIYLFEFMIRTKLELYQRFEKEYDSSFWPEQDTKIFEKTLKFQLEIQKEKPTLYSEYMKGLEFQTDFQTTTLTAKIVFESYPELDSLQNIFSEKTIVDELSKQNGGNLPQISKINKEQIVNSLREKQTNLLSIVLTKMFNNINEEDKNY